MQICKCTICTNLFFKEKEIMPLVNTKEMFEKAYNGVLEAVQNGTISEERINDSLKRIYRIKYANMMPEE